MVQSAVFWKRYEWKWTTSDCQTKEWRIVAHLWKSYRAVRTAKKDHQKQIYSKRPSTLQTKTTEQRRTGLVWKELWVLEYGCKKSTKNFRPPRNLTLSLSRLFIPLHNCYTKKPRASVSGAIHSAFEKSLTVSTRARKVVEFSVAYCSSFCQRCSSPFN